jgi:hypothetical protein
LCYPLVVVDKLLLKRSQLFELPNRLRKKALTEVGVEVGLVELLYLIRAGKGNI